MPLYEFVCGDCQREQEILIRGSEEPVCSACGGRRMTKLLSVTAAPSTGAPATGQRGGGSCGAGCGCHPH